MSRLHFLVNDKRFLVLMTLLGVLLISLFVSLYFRRETVENPPEGRISKETKYRNNLPQEFPPSKEGFGTLIVTSVPDNIKVILDPPESEAPNTAEYLPVNLTPFRVEQIPVGKHSLFASNEGFEFKEEVFEVKANNVTRVEVKLLPQTSLLPPPSPSLSWVNRMPINTENYSVVYDENTRVITATIHINNLSATEGQQKAQILFEEIEKLLAEIGVNKNSQKIEFKIE